MDDGVCSSAPPSVAVVDGRRVLVGTPYAVDDLRAALASGEEPPGLSAEQLSFAHALLERELSP